MAAEESARPVRTGMHSVPIEHLRDAIIFVRMKDGRITQANSAAAELYGYDVDELTKLSITDLIVDAVPAPGEPHDPTRQGLITEEGALFEAVHRRADGTEFPIESNARIISANGDGPEILGIIRDISERKAAETLLQAAHDELDQIFSMAADGMRIIDADFNVVRANITMAEMTGCKPEDLLGSKCYDSFGGEECATPSCPLTRVLDGEFPEANEIRKKRCDGTFIDTIESVRPFVQDGQVVGIVEDFRDITDRKQAEERAHFLATHDPLTWLPNRLLFRDRLALAIAAAERGHCQPGLLFFDIDDFKNINDSLGHAVGDEVMCQIAEAMQGGLRKGDTAARIGGDEFVVLLPNTAGADTVQSVAGKLLETMRTTAGPKASGMQVTVSMGATLWSLGDDDDALMQRADEAMYAAKYAGGDRVVFAARQKADS